MQLQVTPFAQTTPGAHEPEVSVQVVPGAHLQVGGGGRGRSGSVSTALAAKVSAVTATVAVHSKPQQRTNSMTLYLSALYCVMSRHMVRRKMHLKSTAM